MYAVWFSLQFYLDNSIHPSLAYGCYHSIRKWLLTQACNLCENRKLTPVPITSQPLSKCSTLSSFHDWAVAVAIRLWIDEQAFRERALLRVFVLELPPQQIVVLSNLNLASKANLRPILSGKLTKNSTISLIFDATLIPISNPPVLHWDYSEVVKCN